MFAHVHVHVPYGWELSSAVGPHVNHHCKKKFKKKLYWQIYILADFNLVVAKVELY